jgi:integrase
MNSHKTHRLTSDLAASTHKSYCNTFRRIAEEGLGAFDDVEAQGTAQNMRAALRSGYRSLDDLSEVHSEFGILARAAILRLGGHDSAEDAIEAILSGDLTKRVGRVKKLKGLPDDWLDLTIDAAECEIETEHAAVMVMALAGPRPSEIASIGLCELENGDIAVMIDGTKITEVSGQTQRRLTFPPVGLARWLRIFASQGEYSYPFVNINNKRMERIVAKASIRAFGCPRRVNCSTFRNNVSSQLKALEWSADAIAKVLGHQSQKTQKFYGRIRFGKRTSSWMAPSQVHSTEIVRAVAPSSVSYHQSIYFQQQSDSHLVHQMPAQRSG